MNRAKRDLSLLIPVVCLVALLTAPAWVGR